MKRITYAQVLKDTCYPPEKLLKTLGSEDWTGSALDILDLKNTPFIDLFHNIMHFEMIGEKAFSRFMEMLDRPSATPDQWRQVINDYVMISVSAAKLAPEVKNIGDRHRIVKSAKMMAEERMKEFLRQCIESDPA
jgi:hypothetical protein